MAPLLTLLGRRYRRLNAHYQQRWFRYGQIALRSGRPVPGLARLRERALPDRDVAPGVLVLQKDGERGRVHLWVGAVLYGQETDTVDAEVELAPRDGGPARRLQVPLEWFGMESEKAVTGCSPGTRFFHAHVTFDDVAPDAWFVAAAHVPVPALPQPVPLQTTCRARTLPSGIAVGAAPLQIFTASCYDVDTDVHDRLDAAYRALFSGGPGSDLTWITGDATYADAPSGSTGRWRATPRAPTRCWSTGGPGACRTAPTASPTAGARACGRC